MRLMPALLVLLACQNNGTSIGNPNKTVIRIADPGDEVQLQRATLSIASVYVDGQPVDPPDETDVLEGIHIDLPSTMTSVRLAFDRAIEIQGTSDDSTVDLHLEVPRVSASTGRLPFDRAEPHVFELAYPGWLDATEVGWSRGEDHVVRPGDPEHTVLVSAIELSSSLLPDPDGDGVPER